MSHLCMTSMCLMHSCARCSAVFLGWGEAETCRVCYGLSSSSSVARWHLARTAFSAEQGHFVVATCGHFCTAQHATIIARICQLMCELSQVVFNTFIFLQLFNQFNARKIKVCHSLCFVRDVECMGSRLQLLKTLKP